jgi:hypothetical protein
LTIQARTAHCSRDLVNPAACSGEVKQSWKALVLQSYPLLSIKFLPLAPHYLLLAHPSQLRLSTLSDCPSGMIRVQQGSGQNTSKCTKRNGWHYQGALILSGRPYPLAHQHGPGVRAGGRAPPCRPNSARPALAGRSMADSDPGPDRPWQCISACSSWSHRSLRLRLGDSDDEHTRTHHDAHMHTCSPWHAHARRTHPRAHTYTDTPGQASVGSCQWPNPDHRSAPVTPGPSRIPGRSHSVRHGSGSTGPNSMIRVREHWQRRDSEPASGILTHV